MTDVAIWKSEKGHRLIGELFAGGGGPRMCRGRLTSPATRSEHLFGDVWQGHGAHDRGALA